MYVSEFPPVVVVPGGVGTRVHSTKCADHGLEDSQCCNQLHALERVTDSCYDRWLTSCYDTQQ